MFTVSFWTAALERALKTAAQALVLLFGADKLNIFTVDWEAAAGLAAGAAVLSVLTSIVSANIGPHDSPSLVSVDDPPVEAGP